MPRIRFVWAVASLGVFRLILVDVFWCVIVLLGVAWGLLGRYTLSVCGIFIVILKILGSSRRTRKEAFAQKP
jgi:hypothetical protein